MKFRKKPIIVEAEQWFPERPVEGVLYPVPDNTIHVGFHDLHGDDRGTINTLEGLSIVSPGDWVIIGIRGERYPCKSDIFEATYEFVED